MANYVCKSDLQKMKSRKKNPISTSTINNSLIKHNSAKLHIFIFDTHGLSNIFSYYNFSLYSSMKS